MHEYDTYFYQQVQEARFSDNYEIYSIAYKAFVQNGSDSDSRIRLVYMLPSCTASPELIYPEILIIYLYHFISLYLGYYIYRSKRSMS